MSGEAVKIGVFICHCGKNIAKTVDVEALSKFSETLPQVVAVKDYIFMCSEPGQNLIKDYIKERGLNRIVIAACSPKLQEPTFRSCLQEAGLNKFYLEMANIREQCSWAHLQEPERATEKAKIIVKGAVSRAAHLEEVGSMQVEVTPNALIIGGGVAGLQAALNLSSTHQGSLQSVLVIGGGIAGIQASLDLAERGYTVYLVEKEASIGGNMARLYKTFPTNDCAMCILSPKLNDVGRHPNIKLLTCSEVTSIRGSGGKFTVHIMQRPRYVDASKCTGCGNCVEKCPGRAPDEFNLLGQRKAIYIPFPQAIPRIATIDARHCLYLTKNICRVCEKLCQAEAIDFAQKPREVEIKVGAIIVATGFTEFKPTEIFQYGYGRYPNVITQLELARILDPSGPTGGKLVRPTDGKPAKNIIMVQCVGSRDENYYPYCSTICCAIAFKNAKIIKQADPSIEIYICHNDIRMQGMLELYYKEVQKLGVRLIRGEVVEVGEVKEEQALWIKFKEELLGELLELKADLIVLSTPMIPRDDMSDLVKKVGADIGPDGFVREIHPKLRPVETKNEGVLVCGGSQGPKDIPESISQALATSAKASIFMNKGKIEIELVKAVVDENRCLGCSSCKKVCPYDAIDMVQTAPHKRIAHVIVVKCEGCGSCAGVCRTGAMQLKNYKDIQIEAQIKGILS